MDRTEILEEIIVSYRSLINRRYQYERIREEYELPVSFDKEKVDQFRRFFLDYIYPDPVKRKELNDAFDSLDNYIKRPEKLLRLLLDSGRLMLKYGRHLPKILSAGLKALKSFRTANRFENQLVNSALQLQIDPPFDDIEIKSLIRQIPKQDINDFMDSSQVLFETLHDRKLITRVVEIVSYLIQKMKKRPNIYGANEVMGLEIGQEMISTGNQLFDQLSDYDQSQIINFVVKVEREALHKIFETNNES